MGPLPHWYGRAFCRKMQGFHPCAPPKNFLKKVLWNLKNFHEKMMGVTREYQVLQKVSPWGPYPSGMGERFV